MCLVHNQFVSGCTTTGVSKGGHKESLISLVLRRCLNKFDSSLVHCSDFGVRFKCLKFGLCKMFRNPQHHITSQRILFSPIYKTCFFYSKYAWILYFCYIFNKETRFYCKFLHLTGFENVVSKIELDRSSLACTDTKRQTQYSKRFHSTRFHTPFLVDVRNHCCVVCAN